MEIFSIDRQRVRETSNLIIVLDFVLKSIYIDILKDAMVEYHNRAKLSNEFWKQYCNYNVIDSSGNSNLNCKLSVDRNG